MINKYFIYVATAVSIGLLGANTYTQIHYGKEIEKIKKSVNALTKTASENIKTSLDISWIEIGTNQRAADLLATYLKNHNLKEGKVYAHSIARELRLDYIDDLAYKNLSLFGSTKEFVEYQDNTYIIRDKWRLKTEEGSRFQDLKYGARIILPNESIPIPKCESKPYIAYTALTPKNIIETPKVIANRDDLSQLARMRFSLEGLTEYTSTKYRILIDSGCVKPT